MMEQESGNTQELQLAVQDYIADVPDHECEGEGCPYGTGMFLLIHRRHIDDDEDESQTPWDSVTGVHGMSISNAASALVRVMDMVSIPQDSPIPPSLAYVRGREILKRAASQVSPPGEVGMDIADMLRRMIESLPEQEDRDGR